MGKLFVDFEKLTHSYDALEALDKNTKQKTIEDIQDNITSIKTVGNEHDSCFASIKKSTLVGEVENTSEELEVMMSEIETIIDEALDYSCQKDAHSFKIEGRKVDSVTTAGLGNALIWKMEHSSCEEFVTLANKKDIDENYDVDFYNKKIQEIQNSNLSQREKITATSLYMSIYFPHLSYFWGGGHRADLDLDSNGNDKMGVNELWGTVQQERYYDSNGNLIREEAKEYGIDCSGFVNFNLRNSGYDPSKVNYNCNDIAIMNNVNGNIESITSDDVYKNIKPGDIVHMNNHIGMVVKVDGSDIVIAHSSGGVGIGLTAMNTETGLVTADSSKAERVGKPYFTEVLEVSDY